MVAISHPLRSATRRPAGEAGRRSRDSGAADRYLRLYLTNHWLASKGGLDLFRRAARSQLDSRTCTALRSLSAEVAEDRCTLRRILDDHEVPRTPIRQRLFSVGETLGRLKPNGTLFRRSPLSDLLELEALGAAVHAKSLGWRCLRSLADEDESFDAAALDELIDRAEGQRARLEELRQAAVREVYPDARRRPRPGPGDIP